MGERKVLNRYFPPDFDPLLVPKRKYDPYKQVEVRMMIPFSLQCIKCGEYMYRGKKFNSRKEDVIGDDYLGIKKYRFYIKCCVCNNEIAFKTDPKNQDYVCESGAWAASLVFLLPLLRDLRGYHGRQPRKRVPTEFLPRPLRVLGLVERPQAKPR